MPFFSSTEELHVIMEDLWEHIRNHPEMSEELIKSRLTVQFHYRDPDGLLTIDCSDGATMKIFVGECQKKPVVEMFMKSDIAHDFWLGKVNVPVAIMTGKIVSKGPVNRALALLPAVKKAYDIYPTVLEKNSKSA